MKEVKCPNCGAIIETDNKLEVICPVCQYVVRVQDITNESKTIRLND